MSVMGACHGDGSSGTPFYTRKSKAAVSAERFSFSADTAAIFFFIGYYVLSNDEVMERLKQHAGIWIATGIALCIAFSVRYFILGGGMNYADVPANRSALYAADAYFGALAMLVGMARFGDFRTAFTSWMSSRSFGLYMFHYLGISSAALLIARPGILPARAPLF